MRPRSVIPSLLRAALLPAVLLRVALLPAVLLLAASCHRHDAVTVPVSFNDGWLFIRQDSANADKILPGIIPNHRWEEVSLPHTAFIEPPGDSVSQWRGICWYKKLYRPPRGQKQRHTGLLFDGAMNDAIIYLNGAEIARHTGGYLPFYVDLTDDLEYGRENEILVRLDNRDTPYARGGHAAGEPDFLWYSGLYRNVSLYVTDRLHITSPPEYHAVNGGGIMTGTRDITRESATLTLSAHVANDDRVPRSFRVKNSLLDAAGLEIASSLSEPVTLEPGENRRLMTRMIVMQPLLWTPETPFLYTIRTELLTDNVAVIDRRETRIGIRSVKATPDRGLLLNGERVRLTGVNRLQEYPYIGYALSDEASYRDAFKIREAGFNIVRSAHYPPSPAFLDACDELGLMVIVSIPGWDGAADSLQAETAVHDTRMMCRRDRNHPSVVMWETSFSAAPVPAGLLARLNAIVREELPMGNNLTSGPDQNLCDIFTPTRHQASPPAWWNEYRGSKPLFISEYGDREYLPGGGAREDDGLIGSGEATSDSNGSGAAGSSPGQTRGTGAAANGTRAAVGGSNGNGAAGNGTGAADNSTGSGPGDRSSRQTRGAGDRLMLRQAANFQEAHNDNLSGPCIGDALWVAFDYNSGYGGGDGTSGIMDRFRLPKSAYWLYRSQADRGPVCFIAHHNLPWSGDMVRVYSNADTVALYRNDTLIAVQGPDSDIHSLNLAHPPFTFTLPGYQSGTLRAVAQRKGTTYATHEVTTPGSPAGLRLTADLSNKPLRADGADMIFVYATLIDSAGNQAHTADSLVYFTVRGNARLVGENPARAEAGIATILLCSDGPGKIMIRASSPGLSEAELMTVSR